MPPGGLAACIFTAAWGEMEGGGATKRHVATCHRDLRRLWRCVQRDPSRVVSRWEIGCCPKRSRRIFWKITTGRRNPCRRYPMNTDSERIGERVSSHFYAEGDRDAARIGCIPAVYAGWPRCS